MNLFEFGVVLSLIAVKAWCTLCEGSFGECRRSRLEREAAAGVRHARSLLNNLDTLSRLIPTFQLTAALCLLGIGILCCRAVCLDSSTSSIVQSGGIASVIVCIALFFGDLIPRILARRYPEESAKFVFMSGLHIGRALRLPFAPLLWFAELFLSPLRTGSVEDYEVSTEDIRAVVAEAKRSGTVEESERQIINRVFRLSDKHAATVMTPRNHVSVLFEKTPFQESVAQAIASHRSWLPVVAEGGDEVYGIMSARDLLDLERSHPTGNTFDVVRERLTNPIRVPETAPILSLIDTMRRDRIHFAVIVDEYGVFAGVLTLHDIVEALIGEVGELDDTTQQIFRRSDGSLIVDAGIAMDDLWEELSIPEDSPYGDSEFHSLGGFIMSYLGHVPKEGERFSAHGYLFEVIRMDKHRIDKVAIARDLSTFETEEMDTPNK